MSIPILTALICVCTPIAITASNIVLIIPDDLDLTIGGMTPLRNTKKLIGDQGAVFANCFVNSPICCPNRASILTGRYQHNHLTVNNSIAGGCSSPEWQKYQEPNTFAQQIKRDSSSYTTFYAGKYLNQYGSRAAGGPSHVPLGWDWWAGLVGNSKYYDYTLSINGTEKKYGDKPGDYLTDVIGNLAMEFLKTRNTNNDHQFLMVLAPPAPHAPFTPAPRHDGAFKGTKAMRTPNFNTPRQRDKHFLARFGRAPLPESILPKLDEIYRRRWEALLAVDDLVQNVYNTLLERHLINDTYIIFTSDNGYHVGQFSLPFDKRQPYETDIRVPLLIRGPGISKGTVQYPASSVDLFATILDMAGTDASSDGTSLLSHYLRTDRTLLIEYRGEKSEKPQTSGCPTDSDPNMAICSADFACKCQDCKNNTYSCIRRVANGDDNLFCIFEDNDNYVEAYDLKTDAFQITNIGYTMPSRRRHLFRNRLKKAVVCKGDDCVITGTQLID
ncbi:N-acetylglucosamine-6-sulfatase isoform X1 [Neodiprion lecontei]|uniref:N-acetylglucosamine-6-sulfatase isoform X1 n=1 Tax=Neodiprion lecontei TaxID=441921 RepID=A0A6J0C6V7_NEOLC|nr:N-acetylglucosamine-6-sulfatase isoform X1 [Neodiprion lecontei]